MEKKLMFFLRLFRDAVLCAIYTKSGANPSEELSSFSHFIDARAITPIQH